MVNVKKLLAEYNNKLPIESLIPHRSFVAPGVFVTRAGQPGMGIAVDGVDFDTLSPEEVDVIFRRFLLARRHLGPGFRVYQYLIKRDGQQIESFRYDNPAVNRWNSSRTEFLNNGKLSTIRLVMMVIYEATDGNRLVSWAKRLAISKTAEALDHKLQDAVDNLRAVVEAFVSHTQDFLGSRIMNEDDNFAWLREYLNPDPEVAAALPYSPGGDCLGYDAADTEFTLARKHLEIGGYRMRAFVLKTMPSETLPEDRNRLPFLFRELQSSVDGNLIVCSEWREEVLRKSIREAKFKRRIRSGQTDSHKATNDLEAEEHVSELGTIQKEMRRAGYGKFSLTVLLFNTSEEQLKKSASQLQSIRWEGVFIEQTGKRMRFSVFLSTIPGNSAFNVRRKWLSSVNYADCSFLFNLNQGERVNARWNTEYLSVFETNDGTPFYFNLHRYGSELAHTLMLGCPRAGKSTLANQIIGDYQKHGGYTFILDIGGSYRAITEEFGGKYMSLDLERWNVKINPLMLPATPRNVNFMHQFVRNLILNEKVEIDTKSDQDLRERIERLVRMPKESRRLSWLNSVLPGKLKGSLHRWIDKGQYAKIFDNEDDELETARFQTFEFTGMKKHPQALGPLMFYFFHRVDEVVNNESLLKIPKGVFIDEGWSFILDWVVEALKTWPKNNGFVMFITQSESDMESGRFLRVMNETCPNKIILPNPGADVDVYGELLKLNSRQKELMVSMVRPQFMLLTTTGAHVLNYRMEPNWKRRYETQREGYMEATA